MDKKTYLIKQLDYIRINSITLIPEDMETMAEGILKSLEDLEIYCSEENKLKKSYIICRGCELSSKPIYLVKFKPMYESEEKEGHYCLPCLLDLQRYDSTIVDYTEVKQE